MIAQCYRYDLANPRAFYEAATNAFK